jgi:hypothetical protein
MKNFRTAIFLVAGIFLLLVFLAGCVSPQQALTAPANASDALLQNASPTTVSANKNDAQKDLPSPALLKELRKFGLNYYKFGIHKWEFGPDTDEITLYAYSIHNQSQVDALQGTHIGNYTIRILHDTEFERTQHELVQNLTLLQQDSRYQIDHFYTTVDPFGDPPGYYIELWTLGYTPENRKLDNTMMNGWKIQVYPISPDPTNPPLPAGSLK